jgi:hypothetical protein
VPGVVIHSCNLSTREAEAGGFLEFKGNLGYIVKPCQTQNKTNKRKEMSYQTSQKGCDLQCILLSERSQFEKAIYFLCDSILEEGRGMIRWSTGHF